MLPFRAAQGHRHPQLTIRNLPEIILRLSAISEKFAANYQTEKSKHCFQDWILIQIFIVYKADYIIETNQMKHNQPPLLHVLNVSSFQSMV